MMHVGWFGSCSSLLVTLNIESVCIMESFTYTFSHLADAFIQSDLHMCHLQCIHILHFTLMAHYTSGAIRGSVSCSRTLRQGIELSNDFSTSCTTVAPICL